MLSEPVAIGGGTSNQNTRPRAMIGTVSEYSAVLIAFSYNAGFRVLINASVVYTQ